eukprot:9984667-Karenia_brevis.AAC.1
MTKAIETMVREANIKELPVSEKSVLLSTEPKEARQIKDDLRKKGIKITTRSSSKQLGVDTNLAKNRIRPTAAKRKALASVRAMRARLFTKSKRAKI